MVAFSEREKLLIRSALHILAGQCVGDEMHYETESDLGGVPDPDEVRTLLERFKNDMAD